MMSSAVDQVCNKNTVGRFEKIHKASELQASWSPPRIPTADFNTVSKEPARGMNGEEGALLPCFAFIFFHFSLSCSLYVTTLCFFSIWL